MKGGQTTRFALVLLAAAAAACAEDGGDPLAPEEAATVTLDEAALQQAASEAMEAEETYAHEGPGYAHGPGPGHGTGDHAGPGHGQGQGHGPGHQGPQGPIPDIGHPELAVDLATEAVELATSLLDRQGADEEQLALLSEAEELLLEAETALADGDGAGAAHLANHALWTALEALVLPGDVTEEEVRVLRDLAESLLAEARAAVGPEPDDLEAHLLYRAEHLFEHGARALGHGALRGVASLWKTAVIAAYLAS